MKQRIDLLLVSLGLAPSRQRAKGLIEDGKVSVNGTVVGKASFLADEGDYIAVSGDDMPFVGRGGLKLAAAFEAFDINVSGLVCADIGSSTGGFTDCLLQHGAAFVYAVDAGHDQLHASLREREDVCSMEGVNARNLTRSDFDMPIEFVTMDVSFISITKLLPALFEISTDNAEFVCLIKPQFEAGREFVGKSGVVRDKKVHVRVITDIIAFCAELGLGVCGLVPSPIRGQEGNVEYLIHLKKNFSGNRLENDVSHIVETAFQKTKI